VKVRPTVFPGRRDGVGFVFGAGRIGTRNGSRGCRGSEGGGVVWGEVHLFCGRVRGEAGVVVRERLWGRIVELLQ